MIEEYDLIIGNRTARGDGNREHMLKKLYVYCSEYILE